MILNILTIVYLGLFATLAWRRLDYALFLFVLLLPSYILRFQLGPIPTTLLELQLLIILIFGISKFHQQIFTKLKSYFKKYPYFFYAILLFVIASTISIFTSTDTRSALGEWKAFYIEPILFFLFLLGLNKKYSRHLITALLISGLVTSLLAIYQHFTGYMVPYAFWENLSTYRVTAWYGFPNGVGLFLAPIFALAFYNIFKYKKLNWQKIIAILFIPTSLLAIFFAKSTGAIIAVSGVIFLMLIFYKKTRLATIILTLVCFVLLFFLPQLSSVKTELTMQDRSGQIRLGIWHETLAFLKDRPIAGSGLASYSTSIATYHTQMTKQGIEIFHHPHNVFLTIWVNTGILGLLAFLGILINIFYHKIFKTKMTIQNYIVFVSLISLLITGLVDSPYIKNDLAILFWFIIFLNISTNKKHIIQDK